MTQVQNPRTLHFSPVLYPEQHDGTNAEFILDRQLWGETLSQPCDRRYLEGLYELAARHDRMVVLVNGETLYAALSTVAEPPGLDAEYIGALRHRDGRDGILSYAREVCLSGLSSVSQSGLGSVVILGGAYDGPREVA